QGSQAARGRIGHRRSWPPALLLGAHGQEHRPRRDQSIEPAQPHAGGRLRAQTGTDLGPPSGSGGVMRTTSAEHGTDESAPALDAEADTTASICPPTLGESSLGDGEAGDVPEAPGGGAEPGAPIAERSAAPSPDLSGADPASGLARAGSLPPAQLLSSLGTV